MMVPEFKVGSVQSSCSYLPYNTASDEINGVPFLSPRWA